MARPSKPGLDYFPFEVDVFSDMKIMKLCHKGGGGIAAAVYFNLLCSIYKNGYYLEYQKEDTAFKVMVELHEQNTQRIEEIIQICVEVGLFDAYMFNKYHVLTSAAIQERYQLIMKQSKRVAKIDKYNCLKSSAKTRVSPEETMIISEETYINAEETGENIEYPPKNSEFMPQNKLNKTLEKTRTYPQESCFEEEDSGNFDEGAELQKRKILDARIEEMKRADSWLDTLCQKHGLSKEELPSLLEGFRLECYTRLNTDHEDAAAAFRHFDSWLTIQNEKKTRNHGRTKSEERSEGAYTVTDRRRSAPCPVDTKPEDYE